jgi:chaperonin GroES
MNLRPIGDRVLIERVVSASESNGVHIPESVQDTNLEGHVIVVGPGRELIDGTLVPMEISAGDRIVYARFAGTEVKIDGNDFIILQAKDIIAVVGG